MTLWLTVVLRLPSAQEPSPNGLIRRRLHQHHFTRRVWKGRWVGASIPDDHPAVESGAWVCPEVSQVS
jgi:hypothetical protein